MPESLCFQAGWCGVHRHNPTKNEQCARLPLKCGNLAILNVLFRQVWMKERINAPRLGEQGQIQFVLGRPLGVH